jgi:hydrogenase expression/formation protein HypC
MCLAIPGEVVDAYEKDGVRYAEVRFGGVTREVCLHAFPHAGRGEFVLVHVGFAIALIDRAEAERTYELLRDLAEVEP